MNSDPGLQESPRERWPYTFREFEEHLDAHDSRPLDDARYSFVSFDRNIVRIGRYFSEFDDEEEASYKASTFIVMIDHLIKNRDAYDTERFGVAKDDGSLLVSEALQRAVHWYFTSRDRDDWGSHEVIVQAVKEWARRWGKDEGEQGVPRNP